MAMNREQAHEDTAGLKTVQHAVDENDTKPWTNLLVCSLIQDCLVEVFQGYQVLVSEKRELPSVRLDSCQCERWTHLVDE
jgi:hypothetical protein